MPTAFPRINIADAKSSAKIKLYMRCSIRVSACFYNLGYLYISVMFRNQFFFFFQANLLCSYDFRTSFFADSISEAHDLFTHPDTNSKSLTGYDIPFHPVVLLSHSLSSPHTNCRHMYLPDAFVTSAVLSA